jgi:hypothetical protein
MRTMVKFRKQDDKLVIHTVARDNDKIFRYKGKSDRFFFYKELVLKAIQTGKAIIDKDIRNFAEVSVFEVHNIIRFSITWIKSSSMQTPFVAKQEDIYIEFGKFLDWLYSDDEEYSALDKRNARPNKVVFTESGMKKVREVLSSQVVKRKFVKALSKNFFFGSSTEGRRIEFFSDFLDFSFYWRELINGKQCMTGGLILHRDFKDPENLSKAHYSIHT